MTLGQRIRNARIERGMTQKQLVGEHITRNMLSKIENDNATPSVRTLEYIAARLELPVGYFMAGSSYSDGTSPDGLDNMRSAYREKRYTDCIALLEASKAVGTTDEGYLLHALSALGAAREALAEGDIQSAKEYADTADYYNKEGIYYFAEIDAEMSLILAECALKLDAAEFEENAAEFERAVKGISFSDRYSLARTEYLINTDEIELAGVLLSKISSVPKELAAKYSYMLGRYEFALGNTEAAIKHLLESEEKLGENDLLSTSVYSALEKAYIAQEDYKLAHLYASKQLHWQE